MNFIMAAAQQQQDNWPVAIETIITVIVIGIVVIAYFRYHS